jgi:hypothetical protein
METAVECSGSALAWSHCQVSHPLPPPLARKFRRRTANASLPYGVEGTSELETGPGLGEGRAPENWRSTNRSIPRLAGLSSQKGEQGCEMTGGERGVVISSTAAGLSPSTMGGVNAHECFWGPRNAISPRQLTRARARIDFRLVRWTISACLSDGRDSPNHPRVSEEKGSTKPPRM